MTFKEVNVKSILALFIIVFGMCAIVFIHLEDMVLGAIIGFIGVPLSYFFGASKGSAETPKPPVLYADGETPPTTGGGTGAGTPETGL